MRLKLVNDPKHWRERAKEMSTTAARITDPKAKAIMLGGYDKVARMPKRGPVRGVRRPETTSSPWASNRKSITGSGPQLTARWIAFLGYASAAFLLVGSSYLDRVLFVFPVWVLLVSVYILIDNLRGPQHVAVVGGG